MLRSRLLHPSRRVAVRLVPTASCISFRGHKTQPGVPDEHVVWDVDDERALYWVDRKPKGDSKNYGMQYCCGCDKRFEGLITAQSAIVQRRYPGKSAGRLCPRCEQMRQSQVHAVADGVPSPHCPVAAVSRRHSVPSPPPSQARAIRDS